MAKLKVLVVGGGRMGSQIACKYAIGGQGVTVVSRTGSPAQERITRAFEMALQAGLIDDGLCRDAESRILVGDSLDSVYEEPNIVVESIVEEETAKGDLLRDVAMRWPNATIASNTSSLSISALGRLADAEDRVLGTHYWNPPLLMPLVEVIAGDNTELARVESTMKTLSSLGKRPVLVARDVPGFVWNRLQFALLREAVWIVEQGGPHLRSSTRSCGTVWRGAGATPDHSNRWRSAAAKLFGVSPRTSFPCCPARGLFQTATSSSNSSPRILN